jgi:hypothetical protein
LTMMRAGGGTGDEAWLQQAFAHHFHHHP